MLDVARLLNLSRSTLAESNAEESEDIAIGRLRQSISLDQSLNETPYIREVDEYESCLYTYMPLADDGAQLVTSEVHTVEIRQTSVLLHILADQTELAELRLTAQITQRHFEDTPLQRIRCHL